MNRERLLESILYISNYNYKTVFERFPVLNTLPSMPQHGPAFLEIVADDADDEDPCSFTQLEWMEFAPIYKINKYYYSHLQNEGLFDDSGQLRLTEDELRSIGRIEAWIKMDTEPWEKIKLFTCSDLGIVDYISKLENAH